MSVPSCFDDEEQFVLWLELARATGVGSYCFDCTPVYKAQMVGEGRCAWPTVQFWLVLDPEDEEWRLVGVRSDEELSLLAESGYLVARFTLPA